MIFKDRKVATWLFIIYSLRFSKYKRFLGLFFWLDIVEVRSYKHREQVLSVEYRRYEQRIFVRMKEISDILYDTSKRQKVKIMIV